MTDFDIQAARRSLAKRRLKRKLALDERFEDATRDFEQIIKMIIKQYNPGAIYQWGSLLNRDAFSEISDIDVAVQGIKSAENFFSLCRDAEELTDFPLDIVELEKIEPEFKDLILDYGRKVYERT